MASYEKQLKSLGFGFDTLTMTGYNKINGFSVRVKINAASRDYTVFTACRPQDSNNETMLSNALQQFASERSRTVKAAVFDGKQIIISYSTGDFTTDITKGVQEAVNATMYYASQFGCMPCCSSCGEFTYTGIYAVENNTIAVCERCFEPVRNSTADRMVRDSEVMTNYPLGIIGAVLGGLAGALCWILFSSLRKITVVAGFLAGLGGIMGFKWLGKKMTFWGLVISIAVSFVFLLCGIYVSLGIDIFTVFQQEGYDIGFFESFQWIPFFLEDGDVRGDVIFNVIFGTATFALSAVIGVFQVRQENKIKNRVIKLM